MSGKLSLVPIPPELSAGSASNAEVVLLLDEEQEGSLEAAKRYTADVDDGGGFAISVDSEAVEGEAPVLSAMLVARMDGHEPAYKRLVLRPGAIPRVELPLFEYQRMSSGDRVELDDGSMSLRGLPDDVEEAWGRLLHPVLDADGFSVGDEVETGGALSFGAVGAVRLVGVDGTDVRVLQEPVVLRMELVKDVWNGLKVIAPGRTLSPGDGQKFFGEASIDPGDNFAEPGSLDLRPSDPEFHTLARLPLLVFDESVGSWSFEAIGRLETVTGQGLTHGQLQDVWSGDFAGSLFVRGDVSRFSQWGYAWPARTNCVSGALVEILGGASDPTPVPGTTIVARGVGTGDRSGPVVTDSEGRFCLNARPSVGTGEGTNLLVLTAVTKLGEVRLGEFEVPPSQSSPVQCGDGECAPLGDVLLQRPSLEDGEPIVEPCTVGVQVILDEDALDASVLPLNTSDARVHAHLPAWSMAAASRLCGGAGAGLQDCLNAIPDESGAANIIIPRGVGRVELGARLLHEVSVAGAGEQAATREYLYLGSVSADDPRCLEDETDEPDRGHARLPLRLRRASVEHVDVSVVWGGGDAPAPSIEWTASLPVKTDGQLMELPAERVVVLAGDGSGRVLWDVVATEPADGTEPPGIRSPLVVADIDGSRADLSQSTPPDMTTIADAAAHPNAFVRVYLRAEKLGALWEGAGEARVHTGVPHRASSSLSVDRHEAVANGEDEITVTVRVTDIDGGVVPGVDVGLYATGSDNSLQPSAGHTDESGEFVSRLTSTVAEVKLIGCTVGQGAFTLDEEVRFVPGGLSEETSSLVAEKPSALADGEDFVPLVVTALDAHGNPVPGVPVSISASGGGHTIEPKAGDTDSSGVFVAGIVSTAAGAKNVRAELDGGELEFDASVLFAPGPPATLLEIGGGMQDSAVGLQLEEALVVRILDGHGNPIPEHEVRFAITEQPDGASGARLDTLSSVTNVNGEAAARLTLGTLVGRYEVTASAGSLGQVVFSAHAFAGAANELVVVGGDAQSGAVTDQLAEPMVVRVLDEHGNAVSGYVLQFGITGAPVEATGQALTVVTTETDANGSASTALTLGTKAGTYQVTATAATLAGSPVTFDAQALAGPAHALAMVSGDGQSAAVEDQLAEPMVVRVLDEHGNAVSGYEVEFAVTGAPSEATGEELTVTTTQTDTVGMGSTLLTLGTVVGAYQVTATAGALTGSPVRFDATAQAGPAHVVSLIGGDAQGAAVTEQLAEPMAVRVLDAHGNPVSGYEVEFAITGAPSGATGQALTVTTVATDGEGRASTLLTLGTVVGAYQVTATAGTLAGSPLRFDATAQAGPAHQVLLASGDDQSAAVTEQLGEPMVVQVLDEHGNAVVGYDVQLAITGAPAEATGHHLTVTTTATDTEGTASTVLTLGTKVGAYQVTATAGTLAGSPVRFDATARAGPAHVVSMIGGDGQSAAVTEQLAEPMVVRVLDGHGNAVAGQSVEFEIAQSPPPPAGDATLSSSSEVTDATGHAAVYLMVGTKVGQYQVEAGVPGVDGGVLFTATAVSGPAHTLVKVGGEGQDGTVAEQLAQAFVVRLIDAHGNAVGGQGVTFGIAQTPAPPALDATLSPVEVDTDVDGYAHSTLTLGTKVGLYRVDVGVGAGVAPVSFDAEALAGPAHALAMVGGDGQSAAVTEQLAEPMAVRVLDEHGNAVSGHEVQFAIASSPEGASGHELTVTTTQTDSVGMGSTLLTLGTVVGAYQVAATAGSLTGAPLQFGATARAGPAHQLVQVGGDGQTGTAGRPLDDPLRILVLDQHDNPVEGQVITFEVATSPPPPAYDAALSVTLDATNQDGRAESVLTLGTKVGVYRVEARASGLEGELVFQATATAGEAKTLVMVSGDDQSGAVAEQLEEPLVVRVMDEFGNPVSGHPVSFAVHSHPPHGFGFSLSPESATTDEEGLASTLFTVGRRTGSYEIRAESTGLTGSPRTFTVTGLAGPASQMQKISAGDNQVGLVNQSLLPFRVRVLDSYSNPVPGHEITFSIEQTPPLAAGTSLSATSVLTNASGEASSTLTLGSRTGQYRVGVSAGTIGGGWNMFYATAELNRIDRLLPGRTWPGSPVAVQIEIHGEGFAVGDQVRWDDGGLNQALTPSNIDPHRIVVSVPPNLLDRPPGVIEVLVQRSGDVGPTSDFLLGGVHPGTGQTRCYDLTAPLAQCPAEGQPFYGQDPQFGWSLHVGSSERYQSFEYVPGEPIVYDRMTGIEWKGCPAGSEGSLCNTGQNISMTWQAAKDYCQSLDWGGHDDWRLPNHVQLRTIVDYDIHEPSIDLSVFPGTEPGIFWTDVTMPVSAEHAYLVCFSYGHTFGYAKTQEHRVRCARGGETYSVQRFERVHDVQTQPVVVDVDTGLTWQGCTIGQSGINCQDGTAANIRWRDALSACESLVWGGYDDWRLPDINELVSTTDHSTYRPAIDLTIFRETPYEMGGPDYWSSSTPAHGPHRAAVWRAADGGVWLTDKSWSTRLHARCVRGGIAP